MTSSLKTAYDNFVAFYVAFRDVTSGGDEGGQAPPNFLIIHFHTLNPRWPFDKFEVVSVNSRTRSALLFLKIYFSSYGEATLKKYVSPKLYEINENKMEKLKLLYLTIHRLFFTSLSCTLRLTLTSEDS